MAKPVPRLSADQIQRVIATAWDDRPPFHATLMQHGLSPGQLVALLKRELTPNAFKVWSARARGTAAPAPRKRRAVVVAPRKPRAVALAPRKPRAAPVAGR